MFDPATILAIAAAFLIAGTVKGVIGLGLPTVSLALLAVLIDLPTAMALLLVPSFVTNLWQAMVGGNGGAILRRFWLRSVEAQAGARPNHSESSSESSSKSPGQLGQSEDTREVQRGARRSR